MKFPLGLYVLSLLVVTALWWGLGRPEPMPNLQGEASGRPCLSYAPFRGDESPLVGDIQIDPARIAADLGQLATRTGCIRTYGVNHGTHLVPELAKQAGLKVMLGIWLAPEPDRNRRQIDTAIDLARRYPEPGVRNNGKATLKWHSLQIPAWGSSAGAAWSALC